MNAVGYFAEGAKRKSAKRSVGDQNHAFLDFCARQGFEVVATFLDAAGLDGAESGFRQMLNFLGRADHGFLVVVVDSLGAFGADLGESAMKLMAVENTGVQVLSMSSGREAVKELIEVWADRGDGTPVSERVRSAMRRKAVKGEVLGRPPYGYRVGARRRLELVPEEAVVVRYMFRLYLQEGMGIRKIAGQLNEEAVPTRRGGMWSMVSVRDILRNRVYLGTYARFGVKVPGSHPPLTTQDDFRHVQERLQSRHGPMRERTVVPFVLSGLLYCARCGNRLIGVSRKQTWTTKGGEKHAAGYRYYQCESRTNQSSCGYNTQRAADIEARIRALLSDGAPGVTRIRRAGNVDSYMLDILAQVDRSESRMKKTKRQLEELVADAAHGHITLERMRSLGGALAKEQHEHETELADARARVAAEHSEADRLRHLEALRAKLLETWDDLGFDELQLALREVIDRAEVDGEECRLFLRR